MRVLDRVQVVEYEGLYKIYFQCGQYAHRAKLCPKLQPPGVLEPQQAKVSKDLATPTSPFGPWKLPMHVRKRQQQMQAWMTRKHQSSEANQQLNKQLEMEKQNNKNPHVGSATGVADS